MSRSLTRFVPPRHRRTPERLSMLAALDGTDAVAALRQLIALPPHWIDLGAFVRSWNLARAEAEQAWARAGLAIAKDAAHAFGVAPAKWTELGRRIVDALAQHHAKQPDSPGLDATRLRGAADPKLPAPLFALALAARAAKAKAIVAEGPWFRLPTHQVTLGPAEERLWARILPVLRSSKFEPPRVRDFAKSLGAKEDDVRTLFKRLARMGRVVLVAHDHYYLRETVVAMVKLVVGLSERSGTAAGPGLVGVPMSPACPRGVEFIRPRTVITGWPVFQVRRSNEFDPTTAPDPVTPSAAAPRGVEFIRPRTAITGWPVIHARRSNEFDPTEASVPATPSAADPRRGDFSRPRTVVTGLPLIPVLRAAQAVSRMAT